MSGVPGIHFDGIRPLPRRVRLRVEADVLVAESVVQGDRLEWRLRGLRALADDIGDGYLLTHDDRPAEQIRIADGAFVKDLRRAAPGSIRRRAHPRQLRRVATFFAGAAGAFALIWFVLIPFAVTQVVALIPAETEERLGAAVREQLSTFLDMRGSDGTCDAPAGQAALAAMVERLEAPADLPLDLKVEVVSSDLVNAVALPGGHIILFEALVTEAASPEEVAGVLAHEIGHVANRDGLNVSLRAASTAGVLGLVVGDATGAVVLTAMAEMAINASYTREAEAAADEFALDLLERASVPSAPLAGFFERLQASGAGDGVPAILNSHPELGGRADRARAGDTVEGDAEPIISRAEWEQLRRICE